jgi:hypothetical protein
MLCLMFESSRRGYLHQANGQPLSLPQIARMTGCATDEAAHLLQELEDAGVFSRTEHGMIYSRRLVRDEKRREFERNRKQNQRVRERDVTRHVPPTITRMSHASSSSTSSSIHSERDVTPFMVAKEVLSELRIGGLQLQVTLEAVVAAESRLPDYDPDKTKDAMVAAYGEFAAARPKLNFPPGDQKFFGEGYWRDKSKWQWKSGAPSTGKRYWTPEGGDGNQ